MKLKWNLLLAGMLCGAVMLQREAVPQNVGPQGKKVIEYGWDMPSPAYLREHIADMEKRPFNGVIFHLDQGGGQVFDPAAWKPKMLEPQVDVLRQIKWNKFTDNFLSVYAASKMDWTSDSDWKVVLQHAAFCARAARAAHCVGVMFDPEPYGDNPWDYAQQKHAKEMSYDAYRQVVRRRGRDFMNAMQKEFPGLKLLMFYQYSMFYGISHDPDPKTRWAAVSAYAYGLMPAFLDGMLEAAEPGVTLIDGNEISYYYTSPLEFFRSYWAMHQAAQMYVAPELLPKFRSQVRAAQALYIDHLFNYRKMSYVANVMTPQERDQWLEHNTYYGLQSSDEYVWCYSEKMNWWTNTDVPAGAESAISSATQSVRNGIPLGFDFATVLTAAQQRQAEAVQARLVRRTAHIQKLQPGESIKVDGRLNEPVYKRLPVLENFVPYVGSDPEATKAVTNGWVTYDDRNLYVALRCQEPRMQAMKVMGETHDSPVWNGDSVELFIAADQTGKPFRHFILNPANVQWDAMQQSADEVDMKYNPRWTSAVQRGTNEWTVEMAIPWTELQIPVPQAGTVLRANLTRQRTPESELSAWSQTISGFQEPAQFGRWEF